jgi:hypothetical protein
MHLRWQPLQLWLQLLQLWQLLQLQQWPEENEMKNEDQLGLRWQ